MIAADELDPTVFEDAAGYIEEFGWWNGKDGDDSQAQCISNALGKCTPRMEYQHELIEYFGVSNLDGVFEMNDGQTEGKEWAIASLREVAARVRARLDVA